MNSVLLGRAAMKTSSVPPLRNSEGDWVFENVEKADLLGRTFLSKSQLPEQDGVCPPDEKNARQTSFALLRVKTTASILKALNVDKATGPDHLPGRILKECADELAEPVTQLARHMLQAGVWPDCWRDHWVTPLYKKKSVSDPGNYRGVHLTAVLSKAIERVISNVLSEYLEASGAVSKTQWAFKVGHSSRDLAALFANKCILALHRGEKVGVYLSDISGAFDRVSQTLLLEKLQAAGVSEDMLRFIGSYLQSRRSTVIVGGSTSQEFILEDTVFQGTVLGPRFWNVFFDDVSAAVPAEFQSKKFADDLTCLKVFAKETKNDEIHGSLRE